MTDTSKGYVHGLRLGNSLPSNSYRFAKLHYATVHVVMNIFLIHENMCVYILKDTC